MRLRQRYIVSLRMVKGVEVELRMPCMASKSGLAIGSPPVRIGGIPNSGWNQVQMVKLAI